MYDPVQKTSAIQLVRQWMTNFTVQQGPDGLTFSAPLAVQQGIGKNLKMPEALSEWLIDLRLLRHIPLAYLVPDPALLPPESIRFFNVDYNWIDRVIDGVFAAANTGTVDATFTYTLLGMIRSYIDTRLSTLASDSGDTSNWKHGVKPMTGMLMRSEIVRRWPDMILEAFHDKTESEAARAAILRAEPISRDIYIALFAGQPARLHIKEPFFGVRFGVEKGQGASNKKYFVDKRGEQGQELTGQHEVLFDAGTRKLNIGNLATKTGNSSRMISLHLEQLPYRQVFLNTTKEEQGSRVPTVSPMFNARKGRVMQMEKYVARYQRALEVEKL
jgi:hypothetical protein